MALEPKLLRGGIYETTDFIQISVFTFLIHSKVYLI